MLTDNQRDKLTTLAFLGGIALTLIGGGIWVTAPKPVNCNAEAADVETANQYLRNVPRAPLLGEDAYSTARQQATAQVNRAKSAESLCRLKRSGASSSGQKDLGVKVGIAGLAIAGAAGFTLWRDENDGDEPAAQQPETVAAPPPPPPPVPVYDYPVDYPAYAESPAEPEYAEPVEEAPRTRSGWGTSSKRKLTFGDEGSES
ncbi:hypothetical protein MMAG44476_14290 [Mycolicibacterium mageritense DSM 44476 = CIP 104973]|uniref:Uncharacterized protein n=1 Tax=Mycolicibacterium mageritense TaxID=53462 RepID=A0ABM7HSU6_MYCME|nr:hypothetical protein [Mycolicibacterium mageritense]BBX33626.1 hypothetical protein MMAGJ_29080 [Mycolicibacterium mageritense]CDO22054.1 hypothetical protein BN978_02519 [Mycolicibacterium mageritense DSM 44476 = CIP 104973]